METIHIDRYDAAQTHDGQAQNVEPQPKQAWYSRFVPQDVAIPQSVNDASHKVTSFVKERPGVAIAAAVGLGLFMTGGLRRHPLLKSALAAFGVPYLRRQLVAVR